jgi:hypothetical protein
MVRHPATLALPALAALAFAAFAVIGFVPPAGATGGGSECQPLPAAATPSPVPSGVVPPTTPPVLLCVSVQPSQSSVPAGRAARFTVRIQAENGAAPDVSVTLAASPGSATFTGLCPSGDGTASCELGPLGTDVTPSSFVLHAQIPTPSRGATSVRLTATANSANPPMTAQAFATGTMTVTAAPAKAPSPTRTPTRPASSPTPPWSATTPPATVAPVPPPPPGTPAVAPMPTAAPASTSTVAAGNVGGLLPVVSSTPSTAGATTAPPGTSASPAAASRADSAGGSSWLPITGAAVCGSLAVGLAGFLTFNRLRRR